MVSMLFPSSSTHSVEQLKRLNELVLFVQRAVLHFEGLIIDIHLTASGIKFLIVFGLSPVAHSDDPARALLASLALRSSLQAEASSTRWLPDSASFGIASGRVNCLSLGSDSVAPFSATIPRNSLNLIGEARFIAQRLMHAAHGTYGTCSCEVDSFIV
jgi:class 3 adenylate cyclase